MPDRKPNRRSSIYLGQDGWWHGWVTVGIKDDGSPDRKHRMGKTEAEVTRKVRDLERSRDTGQLVSARKRPLSRALDGDLADHHCATAYPPLNTGEHLRAEGPQQDHPRAW